MVIKGYNNEDVSRFVKFHFSRTGALIYGLREEKHYKEVVSSNPSGIFFT